MLLMTFLSLGGSLVLSLSSLVAADIVNSNNNSNPLAVHAQEQQQPQQKQQEEYVFVKKWGSEGDEDGQFSRPHDLDFSPFFPS
jgi:hypothetical protein